MKRASASHSGSQAPQPGLWGPLLLATLPAQLRPRLENLFRGQGEEPGAQPKDPEQGQDGA